MIRLLETLYNPDDILFIGRMKGDSTRANIKTASEWIAFFRGEIERIINLAAVSHQAAFKRLGTLYPNIIPNPLTGEEGRTRAGGKSFRSDACVKEFRYIIFESDTLSLLKQGGRLKKLCSMGWNIVAVIYTGGKSFHAWLKCDGISTLEEWNEKLRGLSPFFNLMGADQSCYNASHGSRLPGVLRHDKGRWQQLLYLAPEGGVL